MVQGLRGHHRPLALLYSLVVQVGLVGLVFLGFQEFHGVLYSLYSQEGQVCQLHLAWLGGHLLEALSYLVVQENQEGQEGLLD